MILKRQIRFFFVFLFYNRQLRLYQYYVYNRPHCLRQYKLNQSQSQSFTRTGAPDIYVCAWTLSCLHNLSTETFLRALITFLDKCAQIKSITQLIFHFVSVHIEVIIRHTHTHKAHIVASTILVEKPF